MTNYASTFDPPFSPAAAAAKRRLTIPQTSKATQEDRPTPFFCRRKGESHQKIITRPGTISSLLTYEARRRSTHTRALRPSHWQNQLPPSCLFKAADVGQPKIRSLQPTNGKSDLFWDLHLPSWQTVLPRFRPPPSIACQLRRRRRQQRRRRSSPFQKKGPSLLQLTGSRLGRGQKKHDARWRQNSAWHTNICFLNCKH